MTHNFHLFSEMVVAESMCAYNWKEQCLISRPNYVSESAVLSYNSASIACCFSSFMLFPCGCKKVAVLDVVSMLKAENICDMACVSYM